MSMSSLWVMNKDFYGKEIVEFNNSWLLSPIVWEILFEKYLPHEVYTEYGKRSYIASSMFDNSIGRRLNEEINNSITQEDRIVWELTQQQVFFTKDKDIVGTALHNFLKINSELSNHLGNHIHERFENVAREILELNEQESPYFIFKNSSVDDRVECWFKDEDGNLTGTLKDVKQQVIEFVVIKNAKISGFISNIDFFASHKSKACTIQKNRNEAEE
ncbi:hypothetical protein NDS46_31795 (plasmid) [Paenibacillus thiaminolyticus]|uniref:hypothetical protein n=1 Tax=Paenibacillus thiaminolyticus TaxID=49283 RepID=UPI00232EB053|nr:hypothetical protein [Paenibacillus thiaminolyticus]WCF11542.1 hypothetical protein NDS46_31795 [Paenibacillus thiaminolyticus]